MLVGNVADIKLEQPENALLRVVKAGIDAGNTTDVIFAQLENAFCNVETKFKLVGIVTDSNLGQLLKVAFIVVILF